VVRRDRVLGSLPVIARFCERLDLRGIVDRACPVRDVAIATHGQVIEALIANRLTSPRPLLHVQDWAAEWAAEEVFGVVPAALNDDRIGRALDAMAPELAGIVGSIGAQAIGEFGIDVARLHWDMTSMSLYGDYDVAEEGFVSASYGHPKDRRPDLKQIQTGLAVTGDGGIPIFHRAFDGRAGEVNQVVGAMESLRSMCAERSFLLVGDSKLVSYDNLRQMSSAAVTFIAGVEELRGRPNACRLRLRRRHRSRLCRRPRRRQAGAAPTGSPRTDGPCTARPNATRHWICDECSSGPRPTPVPPAKLGPAPSPGADRPRVGSSCASLAR
jgi:transposase